MNKEEIIYMFTLKFIETNESGSYWSEEISKRIVKVYAKHINEALEKIKKLGIEYYRDLNWSATEILKGGSNE